MGKETKNELQNTLRNKIVPVNQDKLSLRNWIEAYFQLEVTTMESSQKVQRRDIELFLYSNLF